MADAIVKNLNFGKEARDQMYHIGKNNFGRLIKDNSQWFKQ